MQVSKHALTIFYIELCFAATNAAIAENLSLKWFMKIINVFQNTFFNFYSKFSDIKPWEEFLRLTWPLTCNLCKHKPKYNLYSGFREHSLLNHGHKQLYCLSCNEDFECEILFLAHLYENHFKVNIQEIEKRTATCNKCQTFLNTVFAEMLDQPYQFCIIMHYLGYHSNSCVLIRKIDNWNK